MTDYLHHLKELISAPGLSGHERPIRELIKDTWDSLTDEQYVSRLGSLHGLKKGVAPEPRPGVLIATHMDAIGLMISGVVDGFLRITEIGGLDPRVLPGQLVTIHTRRGTLQGEDLPGMVIQPPSHLLPSDVDSGPVPLEHLWVDTGLDPGEVTRKINIGDLVSFAQEPIEMGKDILAGHTLDNRASVAALTCCLDELKGRSHSWDVWAVATAQEEETLGGGLTSAFELDPELAVAVDVTFAQGPGAPDHEAFPMGEGIVLGWGPNIHPGLHRTFKQIAERLELPHVIEALPRHSGTDAYAMQVARAGIPTMVVSIPLRYMHTPVEVVSMKDIRRAGRTLSEFVCSLDEDFMNTLKLDD